ncbi:Glycosyltransferase involved in cell wall bisynthesis [Lishizhenia tianjinensis]|uniref:Glycosyltransferase involved in cell wall bisynthesis n=1 Tax=Lishizhenia tianjinensis TaxID=477690 RepID=A0A1I6XLU4_9FLAO|nr:glycosyltransferase family 4 protein [Lishizhenia tianjinensis]SFT39250.1 Glycosyltransferase involved in cell wall bisynthesis [Lishizhenia tianjinensis]
METLAFYCSSVSWGGLEMNFIRYAYWMHERGFNVVLYCVKDAYIDEKNKEYQIPVRYVAHNKKYFDYSNASKVGKQFKKDNVTAVWIRDRRDMNIMGLVKSKMKKDFKILYQQAMQIDVKKKDLFHTRRFAKIDLWISPLKFLAEQVKENTNFPAHKIHQIPLATDKVAGTKLSKEEARALLNLPQDKFILGILGRLDPLKGQHFLIKALAELEKKHQDVELLIVGDLTHNEGEDYYQLLQDEVKNLGLSSKVHFRPFMKDTEAFYKGIDLFVMASEGETFGMVTIEAMSYGLPIIGTRSAGTPEILGEGKFGKLYEVNNLEDFSMQFSSIYNAYDQATLMGENARKKALKTFSKQAVCEALEDLLVQHIKK